MRILLVVTPCSEDLVVVMNRDSRFVNRNGEFAIDTLYVTAK